MRLFKFKNPTGQTVLEYMLILAVVGVIVLSSFAFLVPRVNKSSEGYYNSVSRVMMGEDPQPINGGWCPVAASNMQAGAADNATIYRTCECPAPAFGGAYCDPTDSFNGNNVSCLGASCTPTGTCVPQCAGKQCGPDGCGGNCGFCSSVQSCTATGQCLCPSFACSSPINSVPNATCTSCICPQYSTYNAGPPASCDYPSTLVCPPGTGLIPNATNTDCICPQYSYWNFQTHRCVYPSFPWNCPNNLIPNPYFDPNAAAGTPNSFACICPLGSTYNSVDNSCHYAPIVCDPSKNWAPDPTGTQCWCYSGFYYDCTSDSCVFGTPPDCPAACSGNNCGCAPNGCSCGTCGANSTCSSSSSPGQCSLICTTQSVNTSQCGSATMPGANNGNNSTGQCPFGCTGTITAVCNNGTFSITTDTCHP